MQKILLAVGHRQLEDYLKSQINNEYEFMGEVVYKEGITKSVEQKIPDIVIMRETLPGKSNIMSVVYDIRANFPDIRIIFLAGNREVGDELLATLVNYGIYDILYGENIPAQQIISLVKRGNTYNDIKHLQPVPLLDEERNKMLFNPPEAETKVIEVTKEVVVNNEESEKISEKPSLFKNLPFKRGKENKEEKQESFMEKIKIPQVNLKNKRSFESINSFSSSEKIITFIGGKNGVGTTSIAINVAFNLAQQGNNVIFVEFDEKYPAVSYWYELGFTGEGIDTFMKHLTEKKYDKLKKTIIKSKEIKEENSPMKKNYKLFPDTLDFLFFSKEYLSGMKEFQVEEDIKELYLYLLYQMGYDFVIIDVPPDINNQAIQNALMFSNMVFSIITQDVSSIGYYLFNLNVLQKQGIDIISKNAYVVNKYTKTTFGEKAIKKWIGVDSLLIVPEYSEEFILANLEGLPLVLKSRNPELLSSIKRIVNMIN